ncbi:hypothetical protein BW721_05590 [Jeotgalibaca sp. PTS2502]|uniref:DUF1189 family protein n=1 Tax=Jeotgalibaca sp. PTS2502 TaxID=1903686 RepID=UPI000973654F|nr:DUF1189 family protein [Jeotgalibaca sp. PTS2502]APZ49192.1 hypothetical protein BW721_05590 [Jeotgalibaca sp. PTS2502]
MQNKTFPINYFNSVLTPVKNFIGRKQLSWPKLLFVILFLNGIMMIPIVMNVTQTEAIQLKSTFPAIYDLIDEDVVDSLNQTTSEKGQVTFTEPFILEKEAGIVLGGVDEQEIEEALEMTNALVFAEDRFYLKEGDLPVSEIPYTADVQLGGWQTVDDLQAEVNRQWFQYNRVFIVATYSFMITGMILLMNFLLVFGSAFFIRLAGRSAMIEIDTYKESVNLILNAMGIPVLLAFLLGIVMPDISMIMSVQTFGLVLILVLIYFRTQFSEDYIAKRKKKASHQTDHAS